jgi:aspartyl-tRNA(Asn)/glutamyl-tRNA(Gln) amidotransferase subunit A
MPSPLFMTATELAAAYRAHKLSPVEVLEAVIDRAAGVQEALNPFALIDAAAARDAAEASHARLRDNQPLSVLDGVPVAMKDNVQVKGQPRRHGSRMYEHAAPEAEDAPVPATLRAAGAVMWSRTTMPDLGWKALNDSPLYGLTGNPWNPKLSPGGSSGGSAVAVMTGCGPLASGGDGGGSIRVPASWCGAVGIKGTTGRVPTLFEAATATLVSNGPLSRSVLDAAHYMAITCRPDPRDPITGALQLPDFVGACGAGVSGLRIALSRTIGFAEAGRDAHCLDQAAKVLRDAGATVVEAEPPLWHAEAAFAAMWHSAHALSLADVPAERLVLADPGLVDSARQGWRLDPGTDRKAQMEANRLMRALIGFFAGHGTSPGFDLMLCPMMPVAPLVSGHGLDTPDGAKYPNWWDWTNFTWPFNMTRSPGASLPWGVHADGLPSAVQLIAPHFREDTVFRAAAVLEAAQPVVVPPAWV